LFSDELYVVVLFKNFFILKYYIISCDEESFELNKKGEKFVSEQTEVFFNCVEHHMGVGAFNVGQI
jgi:hypothetical protein